MKKFVGVFLQFFYLGLNRIWHSWNLYFVHPKTYPKTKIVSIGNLTVGGTGKTPIVESLLQFFQGQEKKTAVLTRGYGRKTKKRMRLDLKTKDQPWFNFGDEPVWLHQKHPQSVIFIGPDRRHFLNQEQENFDVFLLDDGFQQRKIKKNLDLLVVDSTQALSSFQLLPLGRLREPLAELKRADALLLNKVNLDPSLAKKWKEKLETHFSKPIFLFAYQPKCLENSEGQTIPFSALQKEPFLAVCGLGNPKQFQTTLTSLHLHPQDFRVFPDHHFYSPKEVKSFHAFPGFKITTEKDFVRLAPFLFFPNLWLKLVMEVVWDENFSPFLLEKLGWKKSESFKKN